MKNIYLILLLLFSIFASLSAQDTLFLQNNESIVVDLISIEDDVIQYYEFKGDSSTIFSIPTLEIDKIVYAEGNELDITENEMDENFPGKQQNKYNSSSENEGDEPGKKKFKMKLGLGLMVGACYSTLQYQFNQQSIDLFNTYRVGPAGGLFLEWEIARFLSLRTSFYYMDKGDRTDGEYYISQWEFPTDNPIVYTAEGNGFIDKHLGYVEWDLLPLIGYTSKNNSFQFQIGAGVYASYGILGNEKIDLFIDYYRNGAFDETEIINQSNAIVFTRDLIVEEKLPETLYYNQLDYGLVFYMGIKPRPMNLGASLSWGKANILSTSVEELFYSGEQIRTANNFSFRLTFGYYL
jgi:hypothetical protein